MGYSIIAACRREIHQKVPNRVVRALCYFDNSSALINPTGHRPTFMTYLDNMRNRTILDKIFYESSRMLKITTRIYFTVSYKFYGFIIRCHAFKLQHKYLIAYSTWNRQRINCVQTNAHFIIYRQYRLCIMKKL